MVPKYLRPHLTARIADFLFIEDKDNASFDLEDGRVLNYQQMQELLAQTDEGLNEIERHLGPSRICLHQGADADNTRNFAQNFKNEACSSRRLED